uniref:Lon proteolytic domain-containing protein n=1 Tax=viral metagenome TaxID=1070528 RepID=A0A6C0C9S7_9ZZZZ
MTENEYQHQNCDTFIPHITIQDENNLNIGSLGISQLNEDNDNQYLIFLHKKYTDHVVDFEKHIITLHTNGIINVHDRNVILQELNLMIKNMIKIFNNHLIKNYKEKETNTLTKPLDDMFVKKKVFDHMFAIDTGGKKTNPFHEVQEKLVSLAKMYGYSSMNSFFRLYLNEQYYYLFSKKNNEVIGIYDDVFVPINISLCKKSTDDDIIVIKKANNNYDKLIDNICTITLYFTHNGSSMQIVFMGYVETDSLNTYIRTSQIHSKYLFRNKREFEQLVKQNYPEIDSFFFSQYTKITNSYIYYINSPAKNAVMIKKIYDLYSSLTTKGPNNIIKLFLQSDVKNMYRIINVLLMGDEKMVHIATLLFDSLQDKKNQYSLLRDIIYNHLSFNAQNKLTLVTADMKKELNRLKTLTIENIPIEKKLVIMVDMPEIVKAYIIEKTQEIKSGENNYKLQTAINNLMQFPWKPRNFKNEYDDIRDSMLKSRNYLSGVEKKLDLSVYGHEHSKKTLIELVGKWIQKPGSHGQVLGLVGPPGVGKTLLAKSISHALDIPFTMVGLGGIKDSSDLIGHNFTYANAQCGMIVKQMIKAGKWRSMMFFDEVDKVSKNNDTNEIFNTLIHITDPNMNQHFQDRFYSSAMDFDLSGVLLIFAYNNSELLDPILLDRIKEIKFAAYSVNEKIEITKKHIIKELVEEFGFPQDKILFSDTIIKYIIDKYTNEAGIRELKRNIEKILLKLNIDRYYMRGPFMTLMYAKYVELHNDKHKLSDLNNKLELLLDSKNIDRIFNFDFVGTLDIDVDIVHNYLDKPSTVIEEVHKNDLVGVINGLYASTIGIGGIVPIQIYKNHVNDIRVTNFKLKLTGNQKKVMKESVQCALTVALNIISKKDAIKDYSNGFHIHTLDGGTPKDGPSAGCAFTTAFVSLLLGKKINRYVAMTGEIDLTGKINKIGGLATKLIGAKKAGIKRVYICSENVEDYDMIKKKDPALFDDTFEIKVVNHIIDIVSDPYVILGVSSHDFCKNVIKEHHNHK